jgi:thymidylate synthase
MNTLDKKYQELLQDILDNGIKKSDRTGTGTLSVFGRQIRHKMSEGFPLLTTKKMYWKGIVTELLWFLRGDTNIKYLVDNDCHIWDGDAYKNYRSKSKDLDLPEDLYNKLIDDLNKDAMFPIDNPSRMLSKELFINKIKTDTEFAKQWGELGPVYGRQWRNWGTGETVTVGHNGQHTLLGEKVVDQIQNLINDLKINPDSRRLMVSAWNVGELDSMTLPPCHYGFQVYTRELRTPERMDWLNKMNNSDQRYRNVTMDELNVPTRAISLMFNMRSNDVPLGLPFNLASYGLLLQIIAKEVNMVPDELIASLGDAHIYVNQIDGVKEQLTREPYKLPTLVMVTNPELKFDEYVYDNFKLVNYQSHPTIKIPLSN